MTLTLTIKDFGPIHSVSLSLTPLTILTCDDDTALSLVTHLIYTLSAAHRDSWYIVPDWDIPTENRDDPLPDLAKHIAQSGIRDYYHTYLTPVLQRYLPGYPDTEKEATITIRNGESFATLLIEKNSSITVPECHYPLPQDLFEKIPSHPPKTEKENYVVESFIKKASECWLDTIFPDSCPDPYFIPASRYGIMQLLPWLDDEETQYPPFLEDFIAWLESLAYHETPKTGWWKEYEETLLDGTIIIKENKDTFYDIRIKKGRLSQNLLTRPGSVIALSPIFLYTKYLSEADQIIIIEEIDAHLTENQQTLIGEFLIAMIQYGIQIIITTKNEYFIKNLRETIQKLPPEMFDAGLVSYDMISLCKLKSSSTGCIGTSQQLYPTKDR